MADQVVRFQRKKWALFTFSVVALVESLVVTVVCGSSFAYDHRPNYNHYQSYATNRIILIVVGSLGCVVHMVGLVAISREHYQLISCYTSLSSILAGLALYVSIAYDGAIWVSFIVYLMVAMLAGSVVRDMKRIKSTCVTPTYAVPQTSTQFQTFPRQTVQNSSALPLGQRYASNQMYMIYGGDQETSFSNAQHGMPVPVQPPPPPPPYSVVDQNANQQAPIPGWRVDNRQE